MNASSLTAEETAGEETAGEETGALLEGRGFRLPCVVRLLPRVLDTGLLKNGTC